jgi:glycosyltransferase involved in cell wall biosynthesis
LPTAGQQGRVSVPSKLISYLLAERPVLASVESDSEIARIVGQAGAGWIIEPGDAQQLAQAIVGASEASQAERAEMGTRGRRYAESHFGRENCVARVVSIIKNGAR